MHSEKIVLTQARVAALPLPAVGQEEIFDAKLPGYGIRLGAGGTRTFIFRKKINGRVRRISLGRFPGLNAEQARKLAVKFSGEIAAGEDPADDKQTARKEMTLAELFGEYLDRHAKQRKRTWESDQTRYRLYLESWGNRRLSSLQRREIQALHTRVGKIKGPYAANRLLALISKLFNFATILGYEEENPAKGLLKFKESKRERFLHPHELPKFFQALAEVPNESIRDYVLISLLTGARKGNVLTMQWKEVDWERCLWTIPSEKSKNGDAMEIPLHGEVLEILKRRSSSTSSTWVFPGTGEKGHLVDPKKGWGQVLKKAGISDLRIHDLRRTLGSWQAATGANLSVIGKSLGHKNIATTTIYARLNLDPVRESMNSAVNAMLVAGGVKKKGEVKELPGKKRRR